MSDMILIAATHGGGLGAVSHNGPDGSNVAATASTLIDGLGLGERGGIDPTK